MKFNIIRVMVLIACLCTVVMSALALAGCSERPNERHELSEGDSPLESTSECSTESGSESQTSIDEPYPGQEIILDREYFETIERDILDVSIYLDLNQKALLTEYSEIYPDWVTETDTGEFKWIYSGHWISFLFRRGERMISEFISDYGLEYEDHTMPSTKPHIDGEFNKNMISSMMDDPRVVEIIYYPGGRSESQTSIDEPYPGQEIFLDREYFETIERDILEVSICLGMDDEAILVEYGEIYPDLVTEIDPGEFKFVNSYHWFCFLYDKGEQMVKDFLSDYGLNYDDYSVLKSESRIGGEFDKNMISSMLDDSRVAEIIYYPGGHVVLTIM